MQKVVLDTNILVSAMISINSNPARIVNMALNRELSVCYNSGILFEYDDVLYRPRFDFNTEKVKNIIDTINESGMELTPDASNFPMIDESDRKFYDLHKAANAILITGNAKHFPKEDLIMNPAAFMEHILH
jgi:putative PIN family toxin of toxin-antitoxin system